MSELASVINQIAAEQRNIFRGESDSVSLVPLLELATTLCRNNQQIEIRSKTLWSPNLLDVNPVHELQTLVFENQNGIEVSEQMALIILIEAVFLHNPNPDVFSALIDAWVKQIELTSDLSKSEIYIHAQPYLEYAPHVRQWLEALME